MTFPVLISRALQQYINNASCGFGQEVQQGVNRRAGSVVPSGQGRVLWSAGGERGWQNYHLQNVDWGGDPEPGRRCGSWTQPADQQERGLCLTSSNLTLPNLTLTT